jgi:hypothetical protein
MSSRGTYSCSACRPAPVPARSHGGSAPRKRLADNSEIGPSLSRGCSPLRTRDTDPRGATRVRNGVTDWCAIEVDRTPLATDANSRQLGSRSIARQSQQTVLVASSQRAGVAESGRHQQSDEKAETAGCHERTPKLGVPGPPSHIQLHSLTVHDDLRHYEGHEAKAEDESQPPAPAERCSARRSLACGVIAANVRFVHRFSHSE